MLWLWHLVIGKRYWEPCTMLYEYFSKYIPHKQLIVFFWLLTELSWEWMTGHPKMSRRNSASVASRWRKVDSGCSGSWKMASNWWPTSGMPLMQGRENGELRKMILNDSGRSKGNKLDRVWCQYCENASFSMSMILLCLYSHKYV